jgi:enamine deaminase RidA (YjgF/YER057c/UK114 family)
METLSHPSETTLKNQPNMNARNEAGLTSGPKGFELMEEHMAVPNGNKSAKGSPSSRLNELSMVLPPPPTPLGAYVESSDTGNLLFLSGTLPVVDRRLAVAGRLGENLSVKDGQKAARIAALNALAVAKEHLGEIDRLKKLVKLTVLMATTEEFVEHASVADGASDLFVQIFGPEAGHVRLVYGVQSLPVGAPVIVDTIFEIKPLNQPNSP